jgi:hypothetical protein
MTGGFCVITYMPYEGAMVTEYPTKTQAQEAFRNDVVNVKNNDSDNNHYLLGAALVHIEVVDEKGDWKEVVK